MVKKWAPYISEAENNKENGNSKVKLTKKVVAKIQQFLDYTNNDYAGWLVIIPTLSVGGWVLFKKIKTWNRTQIKLRVCVFPSKKRLTKVIGHYLSIIKYQEYHVYRNCWKTYLCFFNINPSLVVPKSKCRYVRGGPDSLLYFDIHFNNSIQLYNLAQTSLYCI